MPPAGRPPADVCARSRVRSARRRHQARPGAEIGQLSGEAFDATATGAAAVEDGESLRVQERCDLAGLPVGGPLGVGSRGRPFDEALQRPQRTVGAWRRGRAGRDVRRDAAPDACRGRRPGRRGCCSAPGRKPRCRRRRRETAAPGHPLQLAEPPGPAREPGRGLPPMSRSALARRALAAYLAATRRAGSSRT